MKNENILLLHGALGSKTQLEPLKKSLFENFNVFDLNFEGHGGRFSHSDFSIELFSKNVSKFLSENNLQNINIFGYSMGGYVALDLAIKNPSLVNKVVTFGTKFNWSPEIAAKELKMLDPDKIEEKVPPFAQMLKNTHAPNDWKEVVRKTGGLMHGLGNGLKLKEPELKSIQQEILITIGDLDRMVTIEESENSANLLPNGKLQIIEGFKHPIEKNDMNQMAKIIADFIN